VRHHDQRRQGCAAPGGSDLDASATRGRTMGKGASRSPGVCTSAVERVYTLPAFGVDELPDQENRPGECESLDCGGLGFQVELGPALGYWQRLVGGSITA
jgi:hypothetical protein